MTYRFEVGARLGLLKWVLVVASFLVFLSWPAIPADTSIEDGRQNRGNAAVRLYSFRRGLAYDFRETLHKIKAMGISYVSVDDLHGRTAIEFAAALTDAGLQPVAYHVTANKMRSHPNAVVADASTLGVSYVGVYADESFAEKVLHSGSYDQKDVETFVDLVNSACSVLSEDNLVMLYDLHGLEFAVRDGVTFLDKIANRTSRACLVLQLDAACVAISGYDPVRILQKYSNRFASLDLRDIRKGANHQNLYCMMPHADSVPLGIGSIDYEGLISLARDEGIEWYFLEDDSNEPDDNTRVSLFFLTARLDGL